MFKKLKNLFKKFISLIRDNFIVYIGIIILVLIFLDILLYKPNSQNVNKQNAEEEVGVNTLNTDTKKIVSTDVKDLFTYLPVDVPAFKVNYLLSRPQDPVTVVVILNSTNSRAEFDKWLQGFTYPANTKFVFFNNP